MQDNNKKWQIATEHLPPISFFIAFSFSMDMILATVIMVPVAIICLIVSRMKLKKWPIMPLIATPILVVFAGLTVFYNDPRFIKLRPTFVFSSFSLLCIISSIWNLNLLGKITAGSLPLSLRQGRMFTVCLSGIFAILAMANEFVWRTGSDEFWVNYKVFGAPLILFICTSICLYLLLRFYAEDNEDK